MQRPSKAIPTEVSAVSLASAKSYGVGVFQVGELRKQDMLLIKAIAAEHGVECSDELADALIEWAACAYSVDY